MAKLGKIFNGIRVKYMLSVFCVLFCVLGAFKGYSETKSNPFKELVNWTFEQNVGITYLYDLDEHKSIAGAKWNFFTSEHKWLYAGLTSDGEPSLGFGISFNLGKLIEKIKGEPMVYLKHLEVGYYGNFSLNDGEYKDGVLLNVIKIDF